MPMESILTSIKKLLGLEESYEHFDSEIILLINSAFMSANMLGLGPVLGFTIADKSSMWTSFIGDRKDLDGVKTYIFLKVKLAFDPPQMGYLVESIKKQIDELEWRLNVQVESIALESLESSGDFIFVPLEE